MSDNLQHEGDFITKIKGGLNKGLRVVNIRSREFLDAVKIKNKIGSHKKKKKQVISEVGEAVYKMFVQKNQFDEERIREKCREVSRVEQEIKDFEEELEIVHTNARKELGKLKAISKPTDTEEMNKET